jgi:hypothetical protein
MRCPKCEVGTITHAILKMTGEPVALCDYCEIMWFDGEDIGLKTGRPYDSLNRRNSFEYELDVADETEQSHRSIYYSKAK